MTTPQALLDTALAMEKFRQTSAKITEKPITLKLLRYRDGSLWFQSEDGVNSHLICDHDVYTALNFMIDHDGDKR